MNTTEVFIVIREGLQHYYLLKIVQRGLDVYCIPPHLGLHYSVHESGEAHFRNEGSKAQTEDPPLVVLMDGEAGAPFGDGIIRAPLADLGRASGICSALYPIESLSSHFPRFNRSPKRCFVIDKALLAEDTDCIEVGVWAVPNRNQVGFEFNIPDIPEPLLYKVALEDPQIWIYARAAA